MKLLMVVCILGIAFSLCPAAFAADWLPIDPRELALKTPKLDPNADAEIILWDVRLTDELMSRTDLHLGFSHYFCIKVYNDRGVESQGTVDLSWEGKARSLTPRHAQSSPTAPLSSSRKTRSSTKRPPNRGTLRSEQSRSHYRGSNRVRSSNTNTKSTGTIRPPIC